MSNNDLTWQIHLSMVCLHNLFIPPTRKYALNQPLRSVAQLLIGLRDHMTFSDFKIQRGEKKNLPRTHSIITFNCVFIRQLLHRKPSTSLTIVRQRCTATIGRFLGVSLRCTLFIQAERPTFAVYLSLGVSE